MDPDKNGRSQIFIFLSRSPSVTLRGKLCPKLLIASGFKYDEMLNQSRLADMCVDEKHVVEGEARRKHQPAQTPT